MKTMETRQFLVQIYKITTFCIFKLLLFQRSMC